MTQKGIKLERPLIAFDTETTGLDTSKDYIIEIACIKKMPDGTVISKVRRLNPECPIPHEATEVHGIRDEDVANEPIFSQIANSLYQFFKGCDITGFNIIKFDIPLLANEFERSGITFPDEESKIIDSRVIYTHHERRDLASAYQFYCQSILEKAHSAEADAKASLDILIAQVQHYEDLPNTVDNLETWLRSTQPNHVDRQGKLSKRGDNIVLNFGKYRDQPIQSISKTDPGYMRWLLEKAQLPPDAIRIIKQLIT